MTEAEPHTAFGVTRSAAGRHWTLQSFDDKRVLAITQRHGLPELVAQLLAQRDIPLDAIPDYLSPSLRTLLPDPSSLADMDKAATRLAMAVKQGEPIAIFGDYDVDGATSSAVLVRYLALLGQAARVYIPDRRKEGYGPNKGAFRQLYDEGYRLVVTVDCGTMAHEVLAGAVAQGVDVIVADHHQTGGGLPDCYALVNPRRADDDSDMGHLAAVGVTFLLVVGLNRCLRQMGWFAETGMDEPDLLPLLDLVALGTVCDVVPLTGVNRAFVMQGLKVLEQGANTGLRALAQVSRSQPPMGTYQLGFQLGPRVNAGGRVGEAGLGTRLLTCEDAEEATGLAMRLDGFNIERRDIEATVLAEAERMAEAKIVEAQKAGSNIVPPVFVLHGDNWHPGVIGIVAGRLKDMYHRPVFVLSFDENGQGKGSARSVSHIDIGRLVASAVDAGAIDGGGGHAMAAGVSLSVGQLAAFEAFVTQALADYVPEGARQMTFQASLTPRAANRALFDMMQQVGPFGAGNPEPRFVLPHVRVVKADTVGDGHVRCVLSGQDGGRLKAMAFASVDEAVRMMLLQVRDSLHIAGYLRADDWNGRRDVQFMVHDAAGHTSA